MPELSRRQILAGAAATAAVAALPAVAVAAVETASFDVDRFVDICVAETERLHPGVNPEDATILDAAERGLTDADLAEMSKPLPPGPDDYDLEDLDDDGNLKPKGSE